MAFQTVDDTVSVQFIYSFLGQVMENILYFKSGVPVTYARMLAIASNLATSFMGVVLPQLSNRLTLEMIKVDYLGDGPGYVVEYPLTSGNIGGLLDEPLPTQNSIVIRFGTGLSGRSFHGRIYLPGMTIGSVNEGVLEPTYAALLVDAINTLCGTPSDDDWDHVVVSRYSLGEPREEGITNPVVVYSANPQMATQRRRRLGSGS